MSGAAYILCVSIVVTIEQSHRVAFIMPAKEGNRGRNNLELVGMDLRGREHTQEGEISRRRRIE